MICTNYFRRALVRTTHYCFCTKPAKRPIIEPEPLTFKQLDQQHTLAQSKSYNFVMKTNKMQKDLKNLFVNQAWSPASLLMHNHYHLFPPAMAQLNRQQSYKAFEKLLDQRFENSFKNCKSPNEVFHMSRKVQIHRRIYQDRVGVIDQQKFRHYPMWIPFRELRGIKTLKNYESKGVEIKVLKQSIFPTGKIWLPTRQNYLELFDKYLTTTGITSQADTAIDVGCGSGVLSFILAKKMKKSSKIVGIDINENAVLTANINASRLQINNFKAYKFDILKLEEFRLLEGNQDFPKQFGIIISNPPWIVAKKMDTKQIGLQDGVYDEKEQFINSLLKFSHKYLKPDGRLILFYSTLSGELCLTKNTIESLCEKHQLAVRQKLQAPYVQKLQKDDPLAVYKQQSTIQLFQIKKI